MSSGLLEYTFIVLSASTQFVVEVNKKMRVFKSSIFIVCNLFVLTLFFVLEITIVQIYRTNIRTMYSENSIFPGLLIYLQVIGICLT